MPHRRALSAPTRTTLILDQATRDDLLLIAAHHRLDTMTAAVKVAVKQVADAIRDEERRRRRLNERE